MAFSQQTQLLLEELNYSLSRIRDEEVQSLMDAILSARRIFVAGAGRSLLMMRGFAMRLMHLEMTSFVVGETVTPSIGPGDLLIIGSGSGETGTLKIYAQKALAAGAKLALITVHPDSTLGQMADHKLVIAASTVKNAQDTGFVSRQPGASMFEQTLLLLGDALILALQERLGVTDINESMNRLHANLE